MKFDGGLGNLMKQAEKLKENMEKVQTEARRKNRGSVFRRRHGNRDGKSHR